ncbi:uncharacterized protein LOC134832745 [Culicoides brevitarsis]|uniref:uncharacterized protein LOC134832745 n=1 Tax=Culicoides brevitarsis TaxID=469753 RepID=UPI00307C0081
MDKLEPIPAKSVSSLRDLYKNSTKNVLPYNLLDNYVRYRTIDSTFVDENFQIMCLNGDWSDGTFYLLNDNELFFYTLNEDQGRLRRLLALFQFNQPSLYASYTYLRHLSVLDTLPWRKIAVESTKFYHLPSWKALLMDTKAPDGLHVTSLKAKDLDLTYELYPYKHEVSFSHFQMFHRFNKTVAVYDDTNEELLGWCFLRQSNAFTALQVRKEHRRRGLGSVLVRNMAKLLAQEGKDSFAIVVDGNKASAKLFKSEGFECIDRVFNVQVAPKSKILSKL